VIQGAVRVRRHTFFDAIPLALAASMARQGADFERGHTPVLRPLTALGGRIGGPFY